MVYVQKVSNVIKKYWKFHASYFCEACTVMPVDVGWVPCSLFLTHIQRRVIMDIHSCMV